MTLIRREQRPDGTENIIVTPDPALWEVKAAFEAQKAMPASAAARKFRHHGSLLDLILNLKAQGIQRIILEPAKAVQLERELKERGMWETHKHLLGELTNAER